MQEQKHTKHMRKDGLPLTRPGMQVCIRRTETVQKKYSTCRVSSEEKGKMTNLKMVLLVTGLHGIGSNE